MFIEERLLDKVSYGSSFGLEYKTSIVTLKSGIESRNALWTYPKGRYSIDYNAVTPAQYKDIRDAFIVCMGALRGFRFKDWSDFRVKEQFLTIGTGAEQVIQLFKRYSFGTERLDRPIFKPVNSTIEIKSNGSIIPYTIEVDGKIKIAATDGAEITASFEFDVPVRFANDSIMSDPLAFRGDDKFVMRTGADLEEIIL